MRIVMMGTGTFAEPTFQKLLEAFPGEVVGLATQPDREVGRRSGSSRQTGLGMAAIAQAHNIPVIQPDNINHPEGTALLAALNPDLCVVAAYGQIFKGPILNIPKYGFNNVHASLLPKYRGAAPVAHAILNGETETGITIFRITTGIDTGDILGQETLTIGESETAGELESRLALLGAELCRDVVARMKSGPIVGTRQDSHRATKAPKITKEMGLINWSKPARAICNHIRAMQPWPTAYTYLHRPGMNCVRIIIRHAKTISLDNPIMTSINTPGSIVHSSAKDNSIVVSADGGDGVAIHQLQMAGKEPVTAAEFLRGYPLPEGSRFGPERLP